MNITESIQNSLKDDLTQFLFDEMSDNTFSRIKFSSEKVLEQYVSKNKIKEDFAVEVIPLPPATVDVHAAIRETGSNKITLIRLRLKPS